ITSPIEVYSNNNSLKGQLFLTTLKSIVLSRHRDIIYVSEFSLQGYVVTVRRNINGMNDYAKQCIQRWIPR
ncbi:unnamed protein product, partial [Sphenostylis stenocarpa]